MPNFRAFVLEGLKPHLPSTWKFVPYSTDLGQISQVTVMLQLDTVERNPQAPKSLRNVTYNLIVIEPKTEPGRADDSLDDAVMDLLDAIDTSEQIRWTTATRSVWADSNPAYSISLSALAEKE